MALTITQKPLAEVSAGLSRKTPIGSALNTEQWQKTVPSLLRDEAFFSATVESARALTTAQTGLQQILDQVRGSKGEIAMDRSKFIADMQQLSNKLGLRNPDPDKRGGLQDFGSERRLSLVYNQVISSAQNRAYYLSGQDPDVLDAWPAQELIRVRASNVERKWKERWVAAGGRLFDGRMIALKADPIWREISRFRVPWPPFDFNSGMGLDEIDREEAEELGLIAPGETIRPSVERDQAKLEASAKGMSPEAIAQLRRQFGDQIEVRGDMVRWKKGATAPARSVEPAQIAIDSLNEQAQILTRSNDNEILRMQERQALRNSSEFRRAGENARASFEEIFSDWRGPGVAPDDLAIRVATEAQVAAASVGAKPLYFDPYQSIAGDLAESLRLKLPPDVEVMADEIGIYVYRPEAVREVLDSDPDFYRPNGESDFEAIRRVSAAGDNGELLGYGARNYFEPGGARVTLKNEAGFVQVFFVSRAEEAPYWAAERAADIESYTGQVVAVQIDLP